MNAIRVGALALLVFAVPVRADDGAGGTGDSNPHRVRGPGDTASCGFCHQQDMRLSQPPLETCLVCHAQNAHAGANEHLQASAASVARAWPPPTGGSGQTMLPLTADGTMWCGTCHRFHDPTIDNLPAPTAAWRPSSAGFAGAVRTAVAARWPALAAQYGEAPPVARFAEAGSAMLRLPVSDGSLCLACHPGMAR